METLRIPLQQDGTMVEVAIPSDIAITVTEIRNTEGDTIPISNNYFKFVFIDRVGNEVCCVHDPTGEHSINTAYNADTGALRLLVPTRRFVKGQLSCKVFTRTADSDFCDGYWDVCTKTEKINIKLVG